MPALKPLRPAPTIIILSCGVAGPSTLQEWSPAFYLSTVISANTLSNVSDSEEHQSNLLGDLSLKDSIEYCNILGTSPSGLVIVCSLHESFPSGIMYCLVH